MPTSTKNFKRPNYVRQAHNQLDYRKVIVDRSIEKDYSPRDPRVILPRMRNRVAFANR